MAAITRSRSNPYPARAKLEAEIMIKTVMHDSKLPLPAPQGISIVISSTHAAIPNIGGLIHEGADGLPVTVELVAAHEQSRRTPWVVVRHPDGHLAVTIEQAYRLGLREVKTFNLQTSRYVPGSGNGGMVLDEFFRG